MIDERAFDVAGQLVEQGRIGIELGLERGQPGLDLGQDGRLALLGVEDDALGPQGRPGRRRTSRPGQGSGERSLWPNVSSPAVRPFEGEGQGLAAQEAEQVAERAART